MDSKRSRVGLLKGFIPVRMAAPVVGSQHCSVGRGYSWFVRSAAVNAPGEDIDHDLRERNGSDASAGFRRPDDYSAFNLRCGPSDVEAAGGKVDVLDTEADEFGPPQAGVGKDDHDVALVAAGEGQCLDLLCGQIAMTIPLGNAAR